MGTSIRPMRPGDAEAVRAIERSAGERFRQLGLDAVADAEPASAEQLATYASAGRAWVATDEGDRPIGYVLVDVVDGAAHVEQVSVRLERQGRGVGRALMAQVERWARAQGRAAITLSTFAAVPWNQPLYERLGYRVIAEPDLGEGLRSIRHDEAARGLDPTSRVCMRLDLAGAGGPAGRGGLAG